MQCSLQIKLKKKQLHYLMITNGTWPPGHWQLYCRAFLKNRHHAGITWIFSCWKECVHTHARSVLIFAWSKKWARHMTIDHHTRHTHSHTQSHTTHTTHTTHSDTPHTVTQSHSTHTTPHDHWPHHASWDRHTLGLAWRTQSGNTTQESPLRAKNTKHKYL